LSTANNWIGDQTGVQGFDSCTQHKSVVSKTFEADIWKSSYDHLTDVGGQRGGCQQLSMNQYKPRQHQTFAIEKIPRSDSNNPILSMGGKKSQKKISENK